MRELAREVLAGEEAWVVGGAVRDELLGRELVDLDIALRDPERAARAYAQRSGGAPFPLSERHGAWRVALEDGRTVDFTPLPGRVDADLATRDFTINAIARPLAGGDAGRPVRRARGPPRRAAARGAARPSSRTTRCACCARCGSRTSSASRLDGETEQLVREHAALVDAARRRADPRRAAAASRPRATGGSTSSGCSRRSAARSTDRLDRVDSPDYRLVAVFGEGLRRLPGLQRAAPLREGAAARRARRTATRAAIHRFRRATEPWALDALAFVGAGELGARGRAAPARRSGRAAAARRRARPAARPRDRPTARRDRRGAGGGDDHHAERRRSPMSDATRERFGRTAERHRSACRTRARRRWREQVRPLRATRPGDERALDSGMRRGRARVRARAARARGRRRRPRAGAARAGARRAPATFPNVSFVEGDATALPFEDGVVRPRRDAAHAAPHRAARSSSSPS